MVAGEELQVDNIGCDLKSCISGTAGLKSGVDMLVRNAVMHMIAAKGSRHDIIGIILDHVLQVVIMTREIKIHAVLSE